MSTHPIIKALQEELAKELKGLVKTHIEDYQIAIPSRLRNSEHENRSYTVMTNSFCSGHEAATERLMTIVEKAVEMAEFYGNEKNWNGYKHWDCMMIETDFEVAKQNDTDEQIEVAGRKAREFLLSIRETVADATTLADASGENFKPGHYTIDAESFDKIIDDLDKEPSEAVKKGGRR